MPKANQFGLLLIQPLVFHLATILITRKNEKKYK